MQVARGVCVACVRSQAVLQLLLYAVRLSREKVWEGFNAKHPPCCFVLCSMSAVKILVLEQIVTSLVQNENQNALVLETTVYTILRPYAVQGFWIACAFFVYKPVASNS